MNLKAFLAEHVFVLFRPLRVTYYGITNYEIEGGKSMQGMKIIWKEKPITLN
jgi:hypothetical protein